MISSGYQFCADCAAVAYAGAIKSLNQISDVTPALLYFAVLVVDCCAAVEVLLSYGASIAPFLSHFLMMDSSSCADGLTVATSGWMTATLRRVPFNVASPANRAFWFASRWQYQRPTISAWVSPPMSRS